MKQFAIYSACIGRYDDLVQPPIVDERFDYIVFCDYVSEKQFGIWRIIQVPNINDLSPIYLARYIKTHPHELLPQYKAWVWVDANITFTDNYIYNRFLEWDKSHNLIGACPHPATDDVYEHIYEMCCFGFEHDVVCLKSMKYLQEHNYPAHYGLCETGILFRRNTPEIAAFNNEWWLFLQTLSKRDQFTFNYLLQKLEIQWIYILPMHEPIAKSSHLQYNGHATASQRKMIHMKIEEKIRQYERLRHPAIYVPYVEKYKRMSLQKHYAMRLRIWGLQFVPIYCYKFIKRRIAKLFLLCKNS